MRTAIATWTIVVVIVPLAGLLAYQYLHQPLSIDRCLDNGGRGNYDKNQGVGTRSAMALRDDRTGLASG
jgi:hypothetical protein